MDLSDLEHIMNLLKQNDVTEFELQQNGTVIKLCRGARYVSAQTDPIRNVTLEPIVPTSATANGNYGNHTAVEAGADLDAKFVKVESPIVGTFYRKPSPDAEPFVKEGDRVNKGDILCIIEAMKLMNEIEAPSTGVVKKVLLNDGQVVEFGEVLFLLEPAV